MISFKNYNDVLSSAESKLFPYCTIALDQFLWCVVGIYTLSQVCIILLCFIVFVTEHHLVFSLLVEILFWWWTCASLTDYKGGGLKKLSDKPTVSFSIFFYFSCPILRHKSVFLSPLNFDSEIYNSNKENSIPCFLVMKLDDEAAVFSAYLGQNWMTSFHTIFSLSYSVRFLSVKQTIPNRNRWVQTLKSQGMTPLKLEIWEGDSTRVNLIVMVRLANVTVTSTTLVRLISCWGCQLWYQSKFESVWH